MCVDLGREIMFADIFLLGKSLKGIKSSDSEK
jgi:hypothetical protein